MNQTRWHESILAKGTKAPTLEKVPWTDVRKSGEQIEKHATTGISLFLVEELPLPLN
jgi:hypothetical protein